MRLGHNLVFPKVTQIIKIIGTFFIDTPPKDRVSRKLQMVNESSIVKLEIIVTILTAIQ